MKRVLLLTTLLVLAASAMSQNHPSEWSKYTSDAYFHDIESDVDKQAALDRARTNLARQIQIRVEEVSQRETYVVDGKSSLLYNSQKNYSTNVDMALSEVKSQYNESQGKYYVIVYINKNEACAYYENEVKMLISNTDNSIKIADNYLGSGFKSKAKNELEKAQSLFDEANKQFFWLNVFGFDKFQIQQYLKQVHYNEQTIKQKLSELEYGTTYCIKGDADLFGSRYVKLMNEIKGDLSSSGCNFVDDPSKADYVITIKAKAREYNNYQGAYFAYVDAAVSIDKVATSQRIFEDEISVKGSHTLGFNEAARDGYKRISKEITKMLKENIKL